MKDRANISVRALEETATRAGHALHPPRGTNGLDFWLHRLYLNLREISERRSDRSPLVVGQKNKREIMRELCAISATYCLRLGREAWDKEAETPPKPAVESQQTRQDKRQALVRPILKAKGWTVNKWGSKAGVGKSCAYEYLRGRRALSEANRLALAEELELKTEDLPN